MTEPALAFNVRGKGRHYRNPETGDEVPSITNVIGILDRPALPRWSAKLVAERAWDLRHSLDNMGRDEAIDILKGSPWRNSTRAANRGTSIHEYLQAIAEKRPAPSLEGEAVAFQDAADTFIKAYKPRFELTEFTVFGDGYAGTADWMANIAGRSLIGDYKTSKALYPEIALQLAAIRHAKWLVTPDGLEPMPEVDGCVGVLLTQTGCDVREVDTTGAYEAFQGCLQAWRWKQNGVDMSPVLWRTA